MNCCLFSQMFIVLTVFIVNTHLIYSKLKISKWIGKLKIAHDDRIISTVTCLPRHDIIMYTHVTGPLRYLAEVFDYYDNCLRYILIFLVERFLIKYKCTNVWSLAELYASLRSIPLLLSGSSSDHHFYRSLLSVTSKRPHEAPL